MLLSDDLKLEPVDLDELLDTTGLEDEVRYVKCVAKGNGKNGHYHIFG